MKLCSWNVRGCNDPLKFKEVVDFIKADKIEVMGILEIRIKSQNMGSKIFPNLSVTTNITCHPNGRIWLVWN